MVRITAAKSAYTTVTSSDPLVPELVVGPIATATITTTVSTKGDGTETAAATTGGLVQALLLPTPLPATLLVV